MSMKAPGMKGAERRHTSASPTEHIRWLRQGGRGTPTATIGGFAALAGATRLWLKTKFSLPSLNRLATPANQDIFAVETKENF
jgi:hypothetical protein